MDFDSVLAGMVAVDGGWTATVPEDWQQGRTAFGGLSAALALSACRKLVPDLPVLRSGQIAYIGPAVGELTMRPTLLRRGKSMTFMGCDLFSGGVVAPRAAPPDGVRTAARRYCSRAALALLAHSVLG